MTPNPTPKGIGYGDKETLMPSQKLGKLLSKVAFKSRGAKTKTTIPHGRK